MLQLGPRVRSGPKRHDGSGDWSSDMPGSGEMPYSCARLKACSAP